MIVDLILDRKDSREYNAHDFYMDCMRYGRVGDDITRAMDGGTEEDVKRALCAYIAKNEYNPLLRDYICRINWLGKTEPYIEEAAALAFDAACKSQEIEASLEERLVDAQARSAAAKCSDNMGVDKEK